MSTVNPSKLFTASCLALIVTAMSFAIRAGILSELSVEFNLSDTQLGWINSMSVIGFPVAMMIFGLLYNYLGAKNLMVIAFIGHLLGLILTIMAGGFWGLVVGAFFIGFANGSVEAACNPLIAEMYPKNKTTMLNRFHVWFPGGIVIGALASALMTRLDTGWQWQIGIMLIPTAIYGYLVFKQPFPRNEYVETSTGKNVRSLFTPLYIFMILCMSLTATTELGTQQWVDRLMSASGAHPMIILALSTGLMALGRQFAGPVIHKFNPIGVLLLSAIVATIGIYLLSVATGGMVYVATIVFALGVMYFWPTMIGFTGEYMPKTGALGMSLMGGAGMFALSVWNPIIGGWIDNSRAEALTRGLEGEAVELAAGQGALGNILIFPAILIVAFGVLFAMRKKIEARGKQEEAEILAENA